MCGASLNCQIEEVQLGANGFLRKRLMQKDEYNDIRLGLKPRDLHRDTNRTMMKCVV